MDLALRSVRSAEGGTIDQSEDLKRCIENCRECHETCQETLAYCLQEGGKHTEASHLTTLLACVEICATSANFMTWGVDLHPQVCGVCAEMCERCADSCTAFTGDETMQHCAEICTRCAQSCLAMAGTAVAH